MLKDFTESSCAHLDRPHSLSFLVRRVSYLCDNLYNLDLDLNRDLVLTLVSRLVCRGAVTLDLGEQITFLQECRAACSRLSPLIETTVYSVLSRAVRAIATDTTCRDRSGGQEKARVRVRPETVRDVKESLAFCRITAPSVHTGRVGIIRAWLTCCQVGLMVGDRPLVEQYLRAACDLFPAAVDDVNVESAPLADDKESSTSLLFGLLREAMSVVVALSNLSATSPGNIVTQLLNVLCGEGLAAYVASHGKDQEQLIVLLCDGLRTLCSLSRVLGSQDPRLAEGGYQLWLGMGRGLQRLGVRDSAQEPERSSGDLRELLDRIQTLRAVVTVAETLRSCLESTPEVTGILIRLLNIADNYLTSLSTSGRVMASCTDIAYLQDQVKRLAAHTRGKRFTS